MELAKVIHSYTKPMQSSKKDCSEAAQAIHQPRHSKRLLKRIQAFEFCDQAWLPPVFHEAFHDCLSFIHRAYRPYDRLTAHIAEWARKSGANVVLDLASGSGEHVALMHKVSIKKGLVMPKFVVSDLYPNIHAYKILHQQLGENVIGVMEQPVSALNVQSEIRHWSMFTAFHHFPPAVARKLFKEVSDKADGLCIVEFTRRNWFDIVSMIFALPVHLLSPFFAKRFTWPKFLFTTLIPIVPLMVSFDGIISALRTYTKEEMISMLPAGMTDTFEVEYHQVWWGLCPLKATLFTLTRK